MATHLTLSDIKQSKTGRRRRDLVNLLADYGFRLTTHINNGHLQMRWDDPSGEEEAVIIGVAGHGANPEVKSVYVDNVIEAIDKVSAIYDARIEANDNEQIVEDNFSVIDNADRELLKQYEVIEQDGQIHLRDMQYPELGVSVEVGDDERALNSVLDTLQNMRSNHQDRLERLSENYGFQVIVGRARGTLLENPGYVTSSVRIPKYKDDIFPESTVQPLHRKNTDPEIIVTEGIDNAFTLAKELSDEIQNRIVTVLDTIPKLGRDLKIEEEAVDGFVVRTYQISLSTERDLAIKMKKRYDELSDTNVQRIKGRFSRDTEGRANKKASAAKVMRTSNSNSVVVDKDEGRVISYQEESSDAPIMTLDELSYLEGLVKSIRLTEGDGLLETYLNEVKEVYVVEETESSIQYAFHHTEVEFEISKPIDFTEIHSTFIKARNEQYGMCISNENFAHMLLTLGFDIPRPTNLIPTAILHFLFPDKDGNLTFSHEFYGDYNLNVKGPKDKITTELVELKGLMIDELEKKALEFLEENGFEMARVEQPTIIAQADEYAVVRSDDAGEVAVEASSPNDSKLERSQNRVYVHKDTGDSIIIPNLSMSWGNAEEFKNALDQAKKILSNTKSGNFVEEAKTILIEDYGFTVDPKNDRVLIPPFKAKGISNINLPDGGNAKITENFVKNKIPKIKAELESLALRAKAGMEIIGLDIKVDTEGMKTIDLDKRKVQLYGAKGVVHPKDAVAIDKAAKEKNPEYEPPKAVQAGKGR